MSEASTESSGIEIRSETVDSCFGFGTVGEVSATDSSVTGTAAASASVRGTSTAEASTPGVFKATAENVFS